MTAQSMINEKFKSSREMTKKLNEARASISRSSRYLEDEWSRNAHGITQMKPISSWGDVGDMGRVLELLKDLEDVLSERAKANRAR